MRVKTNKSQKGIYFALLGVSICLSLVSCGKNPATMTYPTTYTDPNYNNGGYTYTDPNYNNNYYNNGNTGYNTNYYDPSQVVTPSINLATGSVIGKIVDSLTNVGISGATVEVMGVQPPVTITTDAAGNFTLTNVPQGKQILLVSKNDYTNVLGNRNIVIDVMAGSSVSAPQITLVPSRAASNNGFIKAFDNFVLPRGIVIEPGTDDIYIIDVVGAGGFFSYDHGEIRKLNSDGGVVTTFGGKLLSSDLFHLIKKPNGLGVDSGGNVYVADTGHNYVRKYGPSGKYVSTLKKNFKDVFDIAVLSTGDIAVSDPGNSRVVLLDSSMNVKKENLGGNVGPNFTDGIRGIAIDNGDNLYVVDSSAPAGEVVKKFDKDGNRLPLQFGIIGGIEPGHFNNPNDLAIDNRNGDIYVVDAGNNRIQRFSAEGNYLSEFGSFGSENGCFNGPWGVAIDSKGFIYVTDSKNKRIQKFMPGRFGETY